MNNLKFSTEKPIDCIAIGRAGVDLNANEVNRPLEETVTFTKSVGGSPANIIVGMARLGLKTGFIGRVADDQFGKYIKNYFDNNNIDTSNITIDKNETMNGLAFTEIRSPTNCDVIMYRDNVADLKISPKNIKEEYIKKSKVLVVSGTALAQSPSREAVLLAIDYARKHNTIVILDIDYRPYSWRSAEETAIYYSLVAEKCDVIIGGREEFDMMELLTDPENDDDYTTAKKWFDYNAKIVIVKHGKEGSKVYTKDGKKYQRDIFSVKAVKTFGAGDSYAAAFIYGLLQNWDLDQCLEFGSASAAIVVSNHTCSEAMPTVDEINSFLKINKEK